MVNIFRMCVSVVFLKPHFLEMMMMPWGANNCVLKLWPFTEKSTLSLMLEIFLLSYSKRQQVSMFVYNSRPVVERIWRALKLAFPCLTWLKMIVTFIFWHLLSWWLHIYSQCRWSLHLFFMCHFKNSFDTVEHETW